jgi:hypothetical protein
MYYFPIKKYRPHKEYQFFLVNKKNALSIFLLFVGLGSEVWLLGTHSDGSHTARAFEVSSEKSKS